jgi:trans-AT polyketide synthase, acyltransferase and oxidoreductase domains
MYAGQGSQYYHMGLDLYEHNTTFQYWMDRLDKIVLEKSNFSIIDSLYNKRNKTSDIFDQVIYTSPAIFMVEYSLSQALIEIGIKPDYLLGASLGEFVSLAVANVCNYETILETIIYKSQLLQNKCQEGAMLAILTESNVFYNKPNIFNNCEFAADNFDKSFVVSGKIKDIEKTEVFFQKEGVITQRIPVKHAFHSSGIDYIKDDFKICLESLTYKKSEIPIISCAYKTINPQITQEYLWNVIRKPIYFRETIELIDKANDFIYIDLGASGTLANFVNYCLKSKRKSYAIITPFKNSEKRIKIIQENITDNNNSKKIVMKKRELQAYVFPGQGSQKKGMGEGLFEQFKDLTEKADAILGYSIKNLCLNDTDNNLVKTQYTQPALFVVNALSYLKQIGEVSKKPDYLAGHSLGEYNALFASGALDFETGLKLVVKRGDLMSKAKDGGMAAVIGMKEEKIKEVIVANGLNKIDIANFNSPSQIVISGPKNDVINAKSIFESAGCSTYIVLNVSGAFHSRLMEGAREEFEKFLNQFKFSDLNIPVISNVMARNYTKNSILSLLANQITHSVKWSESICYLMGKGVTEFKEIGPGNVLTGMINKIKKEAEPLVIDDEQMAEEIKESNELPINNTKQAHADNKGHESTFIKGQAAQGSPSINTDKADQFKIGKKIEPENLGSSEYKKVYKVKYAYAAGSMFRGVSSSKMVIALGKAGMMSYFGTGGLTLEQIEEEIKIIQKELKDDYSFGMNILNEVYNPENEKRIIDLYLKYGVKNVEASAYMQASSPLVKFRLKGLKKTLNGGIISENRIQAKVSRPEVAEVFLCPPSEKIVQKLLMDNEITKEEAAMAKQIPLATEICAEADSGGHTDQGVAAVLIPTILRLRDEKTKEYNYVEKINLGAAGGIGTPEAAASAFLLGGDYIVTGSINQCTVEAGVSDSVKNMLQDINIQDTDYAPAGDMFEMGAKVQVLKKGVFFPARANKLYELYKHYNSIDELDEKTKVQLEQKYFKKTFLEIFEECQKYYPTVEIEKANINPKYKMSMIFKWYFAYGTRMAMLGEETCKVDYQVPCGKSLGAFNQWIKGSKLENWRNRHVDEIAKIIMQDTADLLNQRFQAFMENAN